LAGMRYFQEAESSPFITRQLTASSPKYKRGIGLLLFLQHTFVVSG